MDLGLALPIEQVSLLEGIKDQPAAMGTQTCDPALWTAKKTSGSCPNFKGAIGLGCLKQVQRLSRRGPEDPGIQSHRQGTALGPWLLIVTAWVFDSAQVFVSSWTDRSTRGASHLTQLNGGHVWVITEVSLQPTLANRRPQSAPGKEGETKNVGGNVST